MEVHDENKRRRRHGDERDEWRQDFTFVGYDAERIAEADRHGAGGRQRLQREQKETAKHADRRADEKFGADEPESRDGLVADGLSRNLREQKRRQRQRHGKS